MKKQTKNVFILLLLMVLCSVIIIVACAEAEQYNCGCEVEQCSCGCEAECDNKYAPECHINYTENTSRYNIQYYLVRPIVVLSTMSLFALLMVFGRYVIQHI